MLAHLSDPRVFLSHQLVHVAVKDDVDVGLQSHPDVVEFIWQRLPHDAHQERLVRHLGDLRRTGEDLFSSAYI